jgi:hypothetical protein
MRTTGGEEDYGISQQLDVGEKFRSLVVSEGVDFRVELNANSDIDIENCSLRTCRGDLLLELFEINRKCFAHDEG